MSPEIPTALKESIVFIYFFVDRKTGNDTLFKMRTDLYYVRFLLGLSPCERNLP